ncbi:PTS system, N-acetylglucosamine-specific IIBC component [Streptomyces sviceus ATCC 29083]|uniref:PTS system, N-acetylglucosamine-specific IIBC component n=1 Tax=Streptomyces sviceus (strain ATCC 29083 / DSM 924 / JCM 4929 / NBRC 13980 / NCIMB 11184 / NRRL 5439 / UC 5370) TaxID=463191 RepID=B5HNU9_STRX2|nr:PTS system, N-acetylglucosamine-specific IIBC component [Streptomyces sviceus ATCC 29083]
MSTATETTAAPAKKRGAGLIQGLQKVGRSLQLPIAVLPAAGILLRFGQPDVFGKDGFGWDKVASVFATAGGAIFDNLPLLFCIGVAIGFAKKSDGSTALAAVVGFLVYSNVLKAFPVTEAKVQAGADIAATYNNPGVLGGIIMGLLSAVLWQRFHRTKLVDWLGFFNGRRLVPIIMAFVGTLMGVFFGLVWEPIGEVISNFGEWMTGLGAFGAGLFGLINRALIPIGMHQFVNSVAWFQIGDFKDKKGAVVPAHLTRFFAGDPTAGQFMAGFFPHQKNSVCPPPKIAIKTLRPPRAPQGRDGHDDLARADLLRDGCDRADRVLVHVHRAGALRDPRGPDRRLHGGDLGAGSPRGLHLLRGRHRLRAELEPGHEALADHPDRPGLRRHLLRRLPLRHRQVQPPHPGPRAR